jgi:hypothetical protein
MAKKSVPKDESFENHDLDLFKTLEALDRKDYDFFDTLTPEQQKKLVPFLLVQWMSGIKGNKDLQRYYLQSTEYYANKYLLNHMIASKEHSHPKLQWLMLCAASPGEGRQFHHWVPKIGEKVSLLKEAAKTKEIQDYYKKIYPSASEQDIIEVAAVFVTEHKKKVVLAKKFPTLKLDEIELLSTIVTDDELNQYERDSGN